MPNSEPNTLQFPYGSRQKRIENFNTLVAFLEQWKANPNNESFEEAHHVATRFCNLNFQYGYVSRKDIVEQALMKVNLL